jgi:hypothetical protein
MGRETGSLHLLAPLLLTGGKGADLVIRGNVVLNSSLGRPEEECPTCPVAASTKFDGPLRSIPFCRCAHFNVFIIYHLTTPF